MKVVKKYILLAVWLLLYLTAVSALFQQFHICQKAYTALSILISHDSIELSEVEKEEICR